ncbi:MAG: Peptidoglycan-binding domain 1 protein [Hydrocarboniphaga sp.]|uniref:M15 family metallopeptidase n=1 Tax=Hydrocarboniphaga sp. TaxID=2033016 RepID=UPI0026113BB5|nr:M15 family metallopeptidase [Hydrocarboniphaga sp.]MDB5967822.1 Peptidoglycan-binding domain 1 protein [Hydrocarboniphaga sp.]
MQPLRVNRDPTLLHPTFRRALTQVLDQLKAEQIPFLLFEGFRYPERQADLYAQGRTKPGAIVTRALPWRSYHQFGLGADLVLFDNGAWSWDTAGPRAPWWARMQALGREAGLAPLDFEKPHLQLAGLSSNDFADGVYPPAGDDDWSEHLAAVIAGWKGEPPAPPPPAIAVRPAL